MNNFGDSKEQARIGKAAVKKFGEDNSWDEKNWSKVAKERFQLADVWQKIAPDGFWEAGENSYVLAECYIRVKQLKGGCTGKIARDVLKLISAKNAIGAIAKKTRKKIAIYLVLLLPFQLKDFLESKGWLWSAIDGVVHVEWIQLDENDINSL